MTQMGQTSDKTQIEMQNRKIKDYESRIAYLEGTVKGQGKQIEILTSIIT